MSIRRKTFLTMIAATVLLFAALYVMSRIIIQNRFVRLEQEYATGQGELVLRGIGSSFDRLHEVGKNLAQSDETFQYAIDPSMQLSNNELSPVSLAAQNIQVVILMGRNGQIILGNLVDPGGQSSGQIPSDMLGLLNDWNLKAEVENNQLPLEGFFHSDAGDYLLIFQPILKKDGSGSQAGWLVLGRSLPGAELETLIRTSGQELRLVNANQFPEDLKKTIGSSGSVFIAPVNDSDGSLPIYTLLQDPLGNISAALAFNVPRTIYQEGQSSVNSLMVAIGISCLLLLLTLLAVFEILIVRPIVHLAQIRDNNDQTPSGMILTALPNLEDVIKPMEQVAQDVKRVRDENIVRRELFSALVEQAKEGFAVIDPKNLCVMDANDTLCKRIGKTVAEINGMALFDLLGQFGAVLSVSEIEKMISQIKAGEQIHRIVTILPNGHKEEQFIRLHGGTILVADQEFIYIFVQDVSVEVQLQQTLEEKLQETLLLNRVIGAVSSTLDLNQIFAVICEELAITLKVPQAALALLSNDGSELKVAAEYATEDRPSACGDVIPVKNNPSTQWVLQNQKPLAVTDILAGEQDPGLKKMMIRRGTRSMLILPLIVRNHVVGTLGLDSIVERIFNQNEIDLAQNAASAASRAIEIARLYDNLQKELAQRQHVEKERSEYLQQLRTYTEEIALKNEELASARDEALEASRLKSEFLATMSHEIRTPMNAIIGMTELLIDTPQTKEQQDYTEIVRESAQVLLSLINDILDFSKIEAGKLTLEAIDFEPLEMIETAVQMFTPKAQEKSLSLMAYISP
ncbi:MAG: GAF domain-containing protein, partial [Anaerolineaceae bacterium]|nr:GAF domain-containing protein [Anaerolineaceae bacterium]